MEQSGIKKFLVVAVICAFVHSSSAIDCKELWQRKEEIRGCCSAPSLMEPEKLKEKMDGQEGNHHEVFFCAAQNLLQDEGVLNGDEIDVDAIKAKAEGFDDEWKKVTQQAVEDCAQRMQAVAAEMEQRGGPKGACKPLAGMFIMCVGRATMKGCPAAQWNSSELCELVKSGECDKRGPKH